MNIVKPVTKNIMLMSTRLSDSSSTMRKLKNSTVNFEMTTLHVKKKMPQ